MLSDQLDSTRLRAFLARFFGVGGARIDSETGKLSAEHAVSVEVDLPPVVRFDETEFTKRIEFHHGADWRTLVVLHLPTQLTHLILQLPARTLEGVVDRKVQIGIAFVILLG